MQVNKSATLTRTEIFTILSPIREAEGPENGPEDWQDNKQNASKNSPARPLESY